MVYYILDWYNSGTITHICINIDGLTAYLTIMSGETGTNLIGILKV
jgi:hypothetical protein